MESPALSDGALFLRSAIIISCIMYIGSTTVSKVSFANYQFAIYLLWYVPAPQHLEARILIARVAVSPP